MRAFDELTTSRREHRVIEELHGLRASPNASTAELDRELARLVPPFPLKVQLQTTTRCNAACLMCPYPHVTGAPGFEHGEMPLGLYDAILDELARHPVERLSLFLMNEPLLDRRLVDWTARARRKLPRVQLGLFSNGALLRRELASALALAGLDELCVSVHGFERETYERVMVGLSFDRIEPRLRELFELYARGELAPMRLKIVAGDVPEVVATLDRAHPSYRDHVLLKAFSNECETVEAPSAIQSSAAHGRRSPPLCQRPFVKLYVMSDGECVLCNVDWRRAAGLGRIDPARGIGVESIWNGERYREIRRRHLRHEFEPGFLCHRCDYAAVVDEG
jgi:hypothetical protein